MGFLDKSKVELEVFTQSAVVIAGDTITGMLRVTVTEEFECTAVRLRAVSEEVGQVRISDGKRSYWISDTFRHFEHVITFLGRRMGDNGKGGCILECGVREYPFTIQLPPTLPPTQKFDVLDGKLRVSFHIRAYVDIPYGFDADRTVDIQVRSAVPEGLYHQVRQMPHPLGETTSQVYKCSCCCCFCCKRDGATVTISASAVPRIIILATPEEQAANGPPCDHYYEPGTDFFDVPPPNARTVKLLVEVRNDSSAHTINTLCMSLKQCMDVAVRDRARSGSRTIASHTLQFGDSPIGPHTSRKFAVLLEVPPNEEAHSWCPAWFNFGGSQLQVCIDSGGDDGVLKPPLVADGAVQAFCALDGRNCVPAPPYRYNANLGPVVPEHAQPVPYAGVMYQ